MADFAQSLLLQIHTSVDFGMESKIPNFENQYIHEVTSTIQHYTKLI